MQNIALEILIIKSDVLFKKYSVLKEGYIKIIFKKQIIFRKFKQFYHGIFKTAFIPNNDQVHQDKKVFHLLGITFRCY